MGTGSTEQWRGGRPPEDGGSRGGRPEMCSRRPGLPNMPFGLSGAVTFSSPPKRTSVAKRKLIEVSTGPFPFGRCSLFPVWFVVFGCGISS
jgi:hypothetical protein